MGRETGDLPVPPGNDEQPFWLVGARLVLVVGEGFEPSKAEPTILQTAPFGHLGIPPGGATQVTATLR
jgi:hypothetical protein